MGQAKREKNENREGEIDIRTAFSFVRHIASVVCDVSPEVNIYCGGNCEILSGFGISTKSFGFF